MLCLIKKKFLIFSFLCASIGPCFSLPSAYFGKDKEFEFKSVGSYQHASKWRLKGQTKRQEKDHTLLEMSLGISPVANWRGELGVDFAKVANFHTFNMQATRLEAQYLWKNDLVGDPISLSTGLSFIFPKHKGCYNLSKVPYSSSNAELHICMGKEQAQGPSYESRIFATFTMGIKNKGAPWSKARFLYEHNLQDRFKVSIFTEGAYAFSKRQWQSIPNESELSRGAFRFCNVGLEGTYVWDFVGEWNLGIQKRIYARNLPSDTLGVSLGFFIPFFP